jgi:hypothetical protein
VVLPLVLENDDLVVEQEKRVVGEHVVAHEVAQLAL